MPTEHEVQFARYLEGLVERGDRGALASLRRGLGKPPWEAAEMYPYVVRWLPHDVNAWTDACHFFVASLFAVHQVPWRGQEDQEGPSNLGASLARLARKTGSTTVEKRLIGLLNSHADDLSARLRPAVAILASESEAIDWAQLLHDSLRWGSQRRWASAFWAAAQPDVGQDATSPETIQAEEQPC